MRRCFCFHHYASLAFICSFACRFPFGVCVALWASLFQLYGSHLASVLLQGFHLVFILLYEPHAFISVFFSLIQASIQCLCCSRREGHKVFCSSSAQLPNLCRLLWYGWQGWVSSFALTLFLLYLCFLCFSFSC